MSLALMVTALTVASATAAPAASTSPTAPATATKNPAQTARVSTAWQTFLARYLDTTASDGVNRLRYAAVTPSDKAALEDYLKAQQSVKVSALPREEQRAFWINLYNAETVATVLKAYPIKSIRDVKPDGAKNAAGPWDAKLLRVEGKDLSLNDVESGILRAQWKDPRIHFALNCASLGCPNLRPHAFTAANLEKQLDQGAHDFIKSPRGAEFLGGKNGSVSPEGTLRLSSIFDWYKGDFGANDKEVLGFLARYAPPDLAKRLDAYSGKIEYQYDWNLNGSTSSAAAP